MILKTPDRQFALAVFLMGESNMKYLHIISTLVFSTALQSILPWSAIASSYSTHEPTLQAAKKHKDTLPATNIKTFSPTRVEQINQADDSGLIDFTTGYESDGQANLAGVAGARRPISGERGDPFFLDPVERYKEVIPFKLYLPALDKYAKLNTTQPDKVAWQMMVFTNEVPEYDYLGYYRMREAPKPSMLNSVFTRGVALPATYVPENKKNATTTSSTNNAHAKSNPNNPKTEWQLLRAEGKLPEYDYMGYYRMREAPKPSMLNSVFTRGVAMPATYVPEDTKSVTTKPSTNNNRAKIDAKVLEQLQTTAPQPYKKTYTQQVKQPTFSKNMRVYTSDPNDPKTHGRKIRVEYPETWEPQPGISPNNLYKFNDKKYNSPGERRGRTCVINIIDVGENLSPYEWRYVLLEPDIKNGLLENKINILRSIFTQADANPALMIEAEHAYEQVGIKFYSKALYTIVGYKNTIITLVCMTIAGNENAARVLFDDSKPVFWQFMNSFKCLDKWEDNNNPDDDIWTEVEKEVFRVQTDVKQGNYDKLLKQLADNMETGSVCLKDEMQTQRFKQSRDALWAYTVFHTDATITYWLPKYCAEYSVPYKFIRQFQKDIAPHKKDAQNQLKRIMGDEYASCMNYEFLQSNESAELAYFSLEILRLQVGVTKQELCQALDMQSVLPSATNGLINTIKASK